MSQNLRLPGSPAGRRDSVRNHGVVRKEDPLRDPLTAWLDASSLALEAQWVVALRMMRLAAGGAVALREAQRMVSEKAIANAQAQFAAGMAMAAGRGIKGASAAAAKPYRRAIKANHRRLTRRRRKGAP